MLVRKARLRAPRAGSTSSTAPVRGPRPLPAPRQARPASPSTRRGRASSTTAREPAGARAPTPSTAPSSSTAWYDELMRRRSLLQPRLRPAAGRLRAGPAGANGSTGRRRRGPREGAMRVLYVYFGPFDVNSGIQAYHFGNELTDLGWEVTRRRPRRPGPRQGGRRAALRVHLPRRPRPQAGRDAARSRGDDRRRLDAARAGAADDDGGGARSSASPTSSTSRTTRSC